MAVPQNVQYNEEAGVLTWDPAEGAQEYEVGISEIAEEPWTIIGTTTLTSFSLVNAPYDEGYAVVRDKKETTPDPWTVPPRKWKKPPWG